MDPIFMTYTLIGLTGLAGVGKDTVRGILQDEGFTGFAFADPIRAMIRELLTSNGIDDSYMDNRERKETIIPALGVSYRHLAQTLGTEWGRNLASDFWLRIAGAYMDDLAWQGDAQASHFVISDVRFENEAAWIRERGGVIWRVVRHHVAPVRDHVSESGVLAIKADEVIFNEGNSIPDLRDTVLDALKVLA